MRLWYWLLENLTRVYAQVSLAICLLLLIAVLAGFGNSPRWEAFRWDFFR